MIWILFYYSNKTYIIFTTTTPFTTNNIFVIFLIDLDLLYLCLDNLISDTLGLGFNDANFVGKIEVAVAQYQ